jgi:hypothetical protein
MDASQPQKAPVTSQLDYLRDTLAHQVATLRRRADSNRRQNFRGLLTVAALSAAITIATGIKSFGDSVPMVSDFVLIASSLSTLISAWNAFASPRDLWRAQSFTLAQLLGLQTRLEFQARAPDFEHTAATITAAALDEYEAILNEYNQQWQKLRGTAK